MNINDQQPSIDTTITAPIEEEVDLTNIDEITSDKFEEIAYYDDDGNYSAFDSAFDAISLS